MRAIDSMADLIICTNCGLSYSKSEHTSCSHCNFTIQ